MSVQNVQAPPVPQEVQDELDAIIVVFNVECPQDFLALSQFLRRQASRVEALVISEPALEANGQASLAFKGCDPEE